MNGLIIANGSCVCYDYVMKYDYIVCCDGGLRHAEKLNISPDIIIGDMDSVELSLLEKYAHVQQINYPCDKDKTDFELAIDLVISKNINHLTIIGALGGRLDHSLTNINLLKVLLEHKIETVMISEHGEEIRLCSGEFEIHGEIGDIVSFLAFGDEKVIMDYSFGLKFPLANIRFEKSSSLGVSNVFTEKIARVKVKNGVLLVIKLYS